MASADGVLGQGKRAVDGVPDRESPIADDFSKAVSTPPFISRHDDGKVCRRDGQGVSQVADKFGAIVQTAVPGNDSAGRGGVWLRFAMGFFGSAKGAIEDLYAALGIRFVAVGPVRSESRTDFLNVVQGRLLAFEIPSPKLNAHNLLPPFPFARERFFV